MTRRLLLLLALTAPSALRAQQATAPAAPKPRRSVEIRAQAPAPEVITVRPREVPQYTRKLLVPALISPDSSPVAARGAVVVVPAPASLEARAMSARPAPSPDPKPRTP